jgi:uncharacterized membrane protein (UPF0127 family)
MMPVARTLPAEVAARFRGASRAYVRSGDASFEAVLAEGFALRLRGLVGLEAADIVPLLFPRCRSLHTFGMRAEIDIAWLEVAADGGGTVAGVDARVGRHGLVRAPRGLTREGGAALELPGGDAQRFGLEPGGRALITRLRRVGRVSACD